MGHRKPPKSSFASTKTSQPKVRQYARYGGHILTGAWVVIAAIATSVNWGGVQIIESQTQSVFFEIRGSTEPPKDIVILAIDEQSLSVPIQYYQTNPKQYSYLKPLQAWPWQRRAYGQVIDRLMKAGVRSVALDIVFASPSSYGYSDDRAFAQVLQRYSGRVTLAAQYEQSTLRQGNVVQLTQPQRLFWTEPMSVGFVNFPLEPNGQIHRFASVFPKLLAAESQSQFENFNALKVSIPSFENAVVAASLGGEWGSGGAGGAGGQRSRGAEEQRGKEQQEKFQSKIENPKSKIQNTLAPSLQPLAPPKGDRIYFYGPAGTFEQIPFWHVLDPDNWNTYLQQGKYFKDKIVLVGASAAALQDLHKAPFSKSWLYPQPMAGVEIQANAIATLLQKRAIKEVFPHPQMRGLFVLLFVASSAVCLTRFKRPLVQIGWTFGLNIGYVSISYVLFTYLHLILPTAVPMIAIALCGTTIQVTRAIRQLQNQSPSSQSVASPKLVQDAPEQNDQDQQDVQSVTLGKILSGRYKIVKVLGAGGFGETYIAEDKLRPGNPLCVVKKLKPANNHPQQLQVARRLFQLEAETLEKLGKHDQIPQLLAYFEQSEEFYLVQEYIKGHLLSWELRPGKPISEAEAIEILQDLLQILQFVHTYNVIHRDIKPSNIIRRHSDRKLVLIDFGAVKQVSTQLLPGEKTSLTVSIGTHGYAPSEQSAGRAFFSSDVYAVGMTVIKALTGLAPHELQLDATTGELLWTDKVQINPQLAEILSTMVLSDFRQRYSSASVALTALTKFLDSTKLLVSSNLFENEPVEDLDNPTAVWVTESTKIPDSATNILPPSSENN